ncbi:MAG TPA: cyclic nucleotide-binding domain-containing protein [Thermohalobaculum sp.]|nr:cyclic nucleotide-binding domain-containing protein [Thermohalobaculum sp.]
MGISKTTDVLREMELFARVDDRQIRAVAMMGEELSFRDGERLFEQGDEGDAAYVVISGAVEVIVRVDDGERSVATLGQGEIFGEIAVLCDRPRTSAIAAKGSLVVFRLDRPVILNMLREFPDVALQMIRILGRRLELTTQRLARAAA